MLNANIKQVIPILAIVSCIFTAGCSSPEERRSQSLAEAAHLVATGDTITALELLEALSQEHPDDSEILQQIGLVQQKLGNHSESAFYLGAAHSLSPNNQELLFQTYLAHEKDEQLDAARDFLKAYAESNPTAMTNVLWFRLGELHTQAQKTEAALNAYLEGVKLTNEKPPAEIALAIGTLFKQLNNLPMAGRWLTMVAKSDDPNALPALFGILEIHLSNENWEAAEKSIALLDQKFPGAVDASEWASARLELKKWRNGQTEMKKQLEQLAQSESVQQDEPANEPVETTVPTANTDIQTEASGKEQIVVDMANAEAIAQTSTSESETEETSETIQVSEQAESPESGIVFNPDIIIQPAEPDVDFYDDITEPNVDVVLIDEIVDSDTYFDDETADQPGEQILVDYDPVYPDNKAQQEPTPEPDTSSLDTKSLSLEEIIIRAEEATSGHNYEKAAQLYWDALGRTNSRAEIWNALSKVYFADGQAKNAATTALEATRLAPQNIQYVLDYLRVVQRVKQPADFIKELEIAYDRFPRSPEVTLSLARGYSRLGGNDYAADILYRRFIQLAPKHRLRPEAEAALARIR